MTPYQLKILAHLVWLHSLEPAYAQKSSVNYAINDRIVLSTVPQGPIAPYLDSFSNSLMAQGYDPHYIHQQVWLLCGSPIY